MRAIGQFLLALTLAGSLLWPQQARALAITIAPASLIFQQTFPRVAGPVSDAVFLPVVRAAAAYWQDRLLDIRALRIEVGWTRALGGKTLAAESDNGGSLAFIAFNPALPWFLDATPLDNSEFASQSVEFQDLGAGLLNTGLLVEDRSETTRFDLFSTALHEIGHALGLGGRFNGNHGASTPILIEDPLPFAGSVIPYLNGHIDGRALLDGTPIGLPLSLMGPTQKEGQRNLASDADILAVAQAGGFTEVQLNGIVPVSEPATGAVLVLALSMLALRRRLT